MVVLTLLCIFSVLPRGLTDKLVHLVGDLRSRSDPVLKHCDLSGQPGQIMGNDLAMFQ